MDELFENCLLVIASPKSSNVARFGIDPEHDTLLVQFNSGAVYAYDNFRVGDITNLVYWCIALRSCGKAFNKVVKTRADKYPFTRIDNANN